MTTSSSQDGSNGLRRRRILLAGASLGLQTVMLPAASQAATLRPGPLGQPAIPTVRAARSFLTRVVRAGDRLVAMGERGLVVLSDDGGREWRQARVPVSVTLTSASFADARQGWMTGHGGVVLHTSDGGESWTVETDGAVLVKAALALVQNQPAGLVGREGSIQQAQRLVDEGADKPLLSICFADAQRGMAVGAFGLAATTDDGGKTWIPCMERLPNPKGMHLYAAAHHGKNWVIGGEQGVLMKSSDDRASFEAMAAPSRRSFFAATTTRQGAVVFAGLLGNACRIEPDGSTVTPIALPATYTILSCAEMRDGRVVLLAQGGRMLISSDGVAPFIEQQPPRRQPLTSLVEAADGGLVATSQVGVARLV